MQPGWGRGACGWLVGVVGLLAVGLAAPGHAQDEADDEPVPPPGRGSIIGTVLDGASARPLVGATVAVDGGGRETTDVNGRYRLFVAPGIYRLRVSAAGHSAATVENVRVEEGRSTRADASLAPASRAASRAGVEVVEVTADVTESTEATQLLKRKMAPTVSDSLGSDAISKTPDSSAAEVVTRVPAVTIKDDKFIIVRGLGERYSSALLNGSRLPSTDPNRRIVPLDIFPADFIESLNIIKTYTPDLPGDFSGGLIDIKLAEPPLHLTYGVNLSLSFNTETTFQDYDTYDGFWQDWLTFGDGPRQLPAAYDPFLTGAGFNPTTTQMRQLVASQPLNWNIFDATAPPNLNVDAYVGDTWGPFGFNLAGAYGWSYQARRDETLNGFQSDDQIRSGGGERFTYDRSTVETQLGAVLSSRYQVNTEHQLFARALVNRQGIDEVLSGSGTDFSNEAEVTQFATSSQYTANQLGMGQLEGAHHFRLLDVDWRASWAPSTQEQPDTKYFVYTQSKTDPQPPELNVIRTSQVQPPQRTYTSLDEFLQDYYVDVIVPFRTRLPFTDVWDGLAAQLKTGANYTLRDRTFTFLSFRDSGTALASQLDLTQQPNAILVPSNFSTNGPLVLGLSGDEPFDASQEIAAGYGMVELPLIEERLRFIGGARLEYSYLTTRARQRTSGFTTTILNDLDPLPSASLVYTPRDDMNVRGVFSQTVSRPEFRELTPTQFPTLPGERTLQGNPFLVSTNITNYDLRWEWFFSPLELVSASVFYKELEQPIELVTAVETSALIDTYVNYDNASLWGVELEARKDFNFAVPYLRRVSWLKTVAPALADVQLLVNASIIDSETSEQFTRPPNFVIAPVPGTKPLQGQSPYVINASLEYEHYQWGVFRLLYNTVGPTIAAKGVDVSPGAPGGVLPDIETQPRNQLDFVWLGEVTMFGTPFSAKFAVENILNDVFLETQGSQVTNRYRTGLTFSTGLTYSF